MSESFIDYVDGWSLITQKNFDGGDACQRNGIYITLKKLAGDEVDYKGIPLYLRFKMNLMMLKVDTGIYVRHPNPKEWASNPDNFSRDQRAMLEISMAVMGEKYELFNSMLYILKRGGFHQNTRKGTDDPQNKWKVPDFITPGQISTYIRGLFTSKITQALSYPILCLLDLGLLVDIATRGDSSDIDNMLATKLLFDNKVNPTLISNYAMKQYLKTDFMKRLERYHSVGKDEYGNQLNGIGPFPDLFKYAYEEYLK